jgi:serine protease Do
VIDGYHYGMRRLQAIGNRRLILELCALCAVLYCVCSWPAELRGDEINGLAAASAIEHVFVDVIHRVEPSVVSVARVRPGPSLNQFNPFETDLLRSRDFDKPDSPDFVPNEFGTGIIVAPLAGSNERFVLTNYHIVHGGPAAAGNSRPVESQIYVRLNDRRGYHARIIAADPRSDLAVLAIDYAALGMKPEEIKPIPLRTESSPLQKGQLVLSLGNPYAIARDGSPSVSWGMIGNISRRPAPSRQRDLASLDAKTIHQYGTLLQVDTRLDLGTSGGALVNLRGQLVGITTSLAALEGYEKSVGFAIPIDAFTRRVIEALCRGYEVEYGFLGLTPLPIRADQLRRPGNVKQVSAVHVEQVIPNSPAAFAGVEPNDVILQIEGHRLLDHYDLMRFVGTYAPDSTVRMTVWRPHEGRELTLTAKLGKWPVKEDEAIIATAQRFPAWRGMTVDYPTGRNKYIGWPFQFKEAVLVTSVASHSPAQAAGVVDGDFISSVGGIPVRTPVEFYEAVRRFDGDVSLELADHRRVTVSK